MAVIRRILPFLATIGEVEGKKAEAVVSEVVPTTETKLSIAVRGRMGQSIGYITRLHVCNT